MSTLQRLSYYGGVIAATLIAACIGGAAVAAQPRLDQQAAQPRSFQRAQAALAQGGLLDARLDLLNTIRQHPKDAAAHALLGSVSLQLGDPVAAEREARKAIAAKYQPNRSLTLLLRSYIAQGRSIALLHDFPIGTATGHRGAVIAVARARANMVLTRFDRAAADLQRAASFQPGGLEADSARIDLAFAQNNLTQAQALVASSLQDHPGAPALLQREAQLDLAQGHAAQAGVVLKSVIAKDPLDIKAKLLLVQALSATGQLVAAQAELKNATLLAPHSIGAAYLQASVDVASHHWHRANATLQKINGAGKQIPGIFYLRAQTDAALGQPAAAFAAAQSFAAQMPGDARAQILLAGLAVQTGHYHVGQAALNKVAAAGPLPAEALDLQAAIDGHAQNWSAAMQADRKALALAPKDAVAWRNMGLLNQQRGNYAKAEQEFRTARGLVPAQATEMKLSIEHRLAVAALLANDMPTATRTIAELDKQGGVQASALLEARMALQQGDPQAAKRALKKLLVVQPNSVPAQLGLARLDLLMQHRKAALSRLSALDRRHPANVQVVVELADMQQAMGHPAAALSTLQRAQLHMPANVALIAAVLRQQRIAKQYQAAAGLLATLAPSQQRQPVILLQRAKLDAAQGHLNAASLSLQALLTARPGAAADRLALVHIDMVRKHPRAAMAVINAGLARDPHQLAFMETRVAIVLSEKGFAAAQSEAASLASNPDHQPQAAVLAGALELSQHHPGKAATAFTAAYQQNPSPILALSAIQADVQSRNSPAAISMLHQAVAKFPDNAALSDMQGSIAIDQHDFPAAAQDYAHSLQLVPQDIVALDNLAWVEGKLGKPDALALAQRAYISAPNPKTADTLGWILLSDKTGHAQRARALALLNVAHAADPADRTIGYHDAVALTKTGNAQAAIGILRPLVSTKTHFADQAAAMALLGKLSHQN